MSDRAPRALDWAPRSILIIKIQGLGDLVLATPAICAIRRRFPDAHLAVAGKATAIDILANEPYIDERIALTGPWSISGSAGWLSLWRGLRAIRDRRFDLLINLTTPLFRCTWLKCQLLDRMCATPHRIESAYRDCLVKHLRRTRVHYRYTCHESDFNFRILQGLFSCTPDRPPCLTIPENHSGMLSGIAAVAAGRPIIGVCPGGSRRSRQWPVKAYAECLSILKRKIGPVFVIFGDKHDRSSANEISSRLGGEVINLCDKLPASELPSSTSSLDVLLTNDSGLAHVAAAVHTPLVVVCGAESLSRYAPVAPAHRTRILAGQAPCSPCLLSDCSHRNCLATIDPAEVAFAVEKILQVTSRTESIRGVNLKPLAADNQSGSSGGVIPQ